MELLTEMRTRTLNRKEKNKTRQTITGQIQILQASGKLQGVMGNFPTLFSQLFSDSGFLVLNMKQSTFAKQVGV